MTITVQGSAPYLSPDAQQRTKSRPLDCVQRSKAYTDQYRTYRPTPSNKPRPDHSATYNGQYRTRIRTVSISQHPTATVVLITRLGTMAITVQGSVPYLSLDANSKPRPDPTRVYTSKPHPDHPLSYNGHCRTMISTVRIARRQTASHVSATKLGTMAITVQGSAPYQSSDTQQETTPVSYTHLTLPTKA